MLNDKLYEQNVEIWAQGNPKEAIYLSYLDADDLIFCKTRNGELNLKRVVEGKNQFYHSATSAQQEAEKWFAKLNLSEIDALYVYGIGLGYYYDVAKAWLHADPKRRFVFIEDDLAVIRRILETERGSEILADSQVKIHYFENIEDSQTVLTPLSELYWNSLTTKVEVSALKYYAKTREKVFADIHHKIVYDISMLHVVLEEYFNFGIAFYRNFYPNLLQLPEASLANGMFNKFNKIPAIICGAGPSLDKQLPLLNTLRDKALIFSGGSSLNALNSFGMQPHFGAGIDPNSPQLDRIKKNTAHDLPFLYRNRLYAAALQAVKGPRVYIAGSGGYDTSDWFEKKFNIDNEVLIDEGFNVVNLCLSLAHAFGCDPIIFVGMDLAYTDMHSYAQGIVDNAAVDKKAILETNDFNEQAILRHDIEGKPIYTLWKWVAESNWIGAFAKANPAATLINATEGGLGFPDVPNQDLASVAEKYLSQSADIEGKVREEIQANLITQVTKPAIIAAMQELCESLGRCKSELDVLIEEANLVIESIKKEEKLPQNLQSGRAALAEIELSEEVGYSFVLDMFNIICSKVLNRDLQQLRFQTLPEWQKAIQKIELNNKKLSFLRTVTEVNMGLIQQALADPVF